MKEIHFLFDDKLDEYLKEVNQVLSELDKLDFETRKHEIVLRTFTKAVIRSLMRPKPKMYQPKMEYKPAPRTYAVSQKRLVHIPSGGEVWPIPQPTPEEAKPIQIKEFKVIPKYIPKVIQSTEVKELSSQEIQQSKLETTQEPLNYVLTAEPGTNRALALAQVSEDYKVLEPLINDKDLELINYIKSDIKKKPQKYIDDDNKLTKLMTKACEKYGISYSDDYKRKIKYYLIRDLIYFGKIDPLLRDNSISKIICDGPGTPVIVERNLKTLNTNITFKDIEKLNEWINDTAQRLNQKISEAETILDAIYKDFKIQATLGTSFSIPKFTIVRQKDMNLLPPQA